MDTGIITKAAQNQAVAAKKQKPKSTKDFVMAMQGEIAKALPSVMTPERFTRIALSALSSNPKLQQCDSKSFLAAMMTAAQLGVEPNTPLGQAYLIPYRNHGNMEVQFQLGYKGLLDLAYRSGDVATVYAETVYQNDEFDYQLGLEPKLYHKPATSDRGEPIAFYAVFKTKDGGYSFKVMSVDDCRQHRKRYSKAQSSPWDTSFEEMAKKTVLKAVLKYAPLKSDFQKAVVQDETIRKNWSEDMSEQADETVYEVDNDTGEVVAAEGVVE